MFRIVSSRRWRELETADKRAAVLEAQLAAERDQRTFWQARACSLLDQAGLKAAIMSAPTMTAGDAPAAADGPLQTSMTKIMTALSVNELPERKELAAEHVGHVDPAAAQAAIDAVLSKV